MLGRIRLCMLVEFILVINPINMSRVLYFCLWDSHSKLRVDKYAVYLRLIAIMDAIILLWFSKEYAMQETGFTEFMTYRAQSRNHNWLMCNIDM